MFSCVLCSFDVNEVGDSCSQMCVHESVEVSESTYTHKHMSVMSEGDAATYSLAHQRCELQPVKMFVDIYIKVGVYILPQFCEKL